MAGVDDDTIAEDYALTRIGREPVRAMIMARLAKVPLFASNHEKALNMLTSRYVLPNRPMHNDTHDEYIYDDESSAEIMHAFLHLLDHKYGGVEEYLRQYVHLADEDIVRIRHNLLVPREHTDS